MGETRFITTMSDDHDPFDGKQNLLHPPFLNTDMDVTILEEALSQVDRDLALESPKQPNTGHTTDKNQTNHETRNNTNRYSRTITQDTTST